MRFQTIFLTTLFIAALLLGGPAAVQHSAWAAPNASLTSDDTVLLRLGQRTITISDIQDREIHELRLKLYQNLVGKLHRSAISYLSKTKPDYSMKPNRQVREEDLRGFYVTQQLASQGSFEALAPRIKGYLEGQLEAQHLAGLFQRAVREGLVEDLLLAPGDYLVQSPVATAFIQGNSKAKVIFLEFSDFQCPYCARLRPVVKALKSKYASRVAFGYRHLPLAFHTEADEAAIAVECARDQGKFEEYHGVLFQNQRNQFPDDLKKFARAVKLPDVATFDQCLENETYRGRINADLKDAAAIGANGTPTVIIGHFDSERMTMRGEIYSGVRSLGLYASLLDKYLSLSR